MVSLEDTYRHQSSLFLSSMEDVKQQINNMKLENAQYRWKTESLTAEIKNLKSQNSELQKSSNLWMKDYNLAQVNLEELQNKVTKSQEESFVSCETICRLESDLAQQLETKDNLRKEIYALKNNKIRLEEELKIKFDERNEFSVENKELKKNLSETTKEFETEKQNSQSKIRELQNSMEELSKKWENLVLETDENKEKLKNSEDIILKKNNDVTQLTEKCNKLRLKKKNLQTIEKQLQETNAKMQKRLGEYERLSWKSNDHQNNTDLSLQGKMLKEEFLVGKTRELETKNEKLQNQLKELKEEKEKLVNLLRESKELYQTREKTCKETETKLKEKQSQWSDHFSKNQAMVNNLQKDLEFARNELKERRKAVSESKQENLEKDLQMQELKQLIREKDLAIKSLQSEEQRLKKRAEDVSKELSQLISKNEKTKRSEEANRMKRDVMKLTTELKKKRQLIESPHEQRQKSAVLERSLVEEGISSILNERLDDALLLEALDLLPQKFNS